MAAVLTIRPAAADEYPAVIRLAQQASAEGAAPALNEQSLLVLSGATNAAARVLVAIADGEPVAAAVAEIGPAASTTELVLPGGAHAAEAGSALLDALASDDDLPADRPVLLWAHGRGSATAPLAEGRGYEAVRSLYKLARRGDLAVPEAPLPDGVELSTFRPGLDDADWLELNAAAFAHHAEQGRWSADDLQARLAEDWFDPAGFFLARRQGSGELLGFHWTKVERDGPGGPILDAEVYVIGVSPAASGMRLGSALLAAGLRHLQQIGAPVVHLYVDGDNTSALALYAKRGFVEADLDVCFRVR
jgi:mycothiol synthase